MNIYFAGSIRGGRDDQAIYADIVRFLQKFGTVLSEHVANNAVSAHGSAGTVQEIFQQDRAWVHEAERIVAEVTTPSLGVGYELGLAEALHKPVLCLFRPTSGKSLSAMIAGNPAFQVATYNNNEEAKLAITSFFV